MALKGKVGRPPPEWLKELAPGEYRVIDLVERFSIERTSVGRTLKRYGAEPFPKIGPNHKCELYVLWKGFCQEK